LSPQDYEILVNTLNSKEKPPDFAVKLLEDTCSRSGLDWKARHVYLMQRGGKWGVTLSIDGFRLIGSQDASYGGQEGPLWVTSAAGTWSDIPPDGPIYAAKVGIKHKDGTVTWGVAKFKDYAAGPMWTKFPSTMIAKCAEMLAWRKAFPGKLGGLYGTEEMEQMGFKPKGPKTPETVNNEGDPTRAEDVDALKNGYILLLKAAPTKEALVEVGATIKEDKGLSMAATMELHALYTARKATYV
jgi:hypothetical protein